MDQNFFLRLSKLTSLNTSHLLSGGGKGIEKESLRVDQSGNVAQSPHPNSLGSALTHPAITTDYSEALLELITPPFPLVDEAIDYLYQIHQYVYANLNADEVLWTASMPCIVGGEQSIPLAWYGESNAGMMKHVYRRGLDVRYGRIMQAISGVHFNYSVPEAFWPFFQEIEENRQPIQDFINQRYMGLTRNVLRYEWLLTYLFGSSPAFCKSFLSGHASSYQEFDAHTCYEPFATSLRMSDIGYKNNQPEGLRVSYNQLEEYIRDLNRAIQTPYKPYEKFGVVVDGFYRQLNANILQIANEYYSSIRPKQPTYPAEKPTSALEKRGIRYVELRALDVTTFEPIGVSTQQLHFLEAFMLYCLLSESPPFTEQERQQIEANQNATALRGRDPSLTLYRNGTNPTLQTWAGEILAQIEPICTLLDHGGDAYTRALAHQQEAVKDSALTPSARTLEEMRAYGESFFEFALRYAQRHRDSITQSVLAPEVEEHFAQLARESLQKQAELEASEEVPFSVYLEEYFGRG